VPHRFALGRVYACRPACSDVICSGISAASTFQNGQGALGRAFRSEPLPSRIRHIRSAEEMVRRPGGSAFFLLFRVQAVKLMLRMPRRVKSVLVSHSIGNDFENVLFRSLKAVLSLSGLHVVPDESFLGLLHPIRPADDDIDSLRSSFRRVGRNPLTFERADRDLFRRVVELVASADTIVMLWSKDFASKFWTRLEWKTAIAMIKPVFILVVDGFPLPSELGCAQSVGLLRVFTFNSDYRAAALAHAVASADLDDYLPSLCYRGTELEKKTGIEFLTLRHPLLGEFGISKGLVTESQAARSMSELSVSNPGNGGCDDSPMRVSWDQASQICERIPDAEWSYRLPTEVEWEFAARAGETSFRGLTTLGTVFGEGRNNSSDSNDGSNRWGMMELSREPAEWYIDQIVLWPYNG
jgi:hypothetical protein